jgi:adenosylmethionine-8-amino-7-oxononanoate aminotransferase
MSAIMSGMSAVNQYTVHRDWQWEFPLMERAEGIYLYDADGRRYIDATGGSSVVVTIGHGVKEVPEAMYRQSGKFSFYPTHLFTNTATLELGRRVVELVPDGMRGNAKVWFSCTGTDATDEAVRLARQHFVEKGQVSKYLIISRWQAFHGNSVSAAGYSGHTLRRRIFMPMFVDSPHIPPAYCYRCPFDSALPGCGLKCAQALETAILQYGPENVAAFIAEPVVGAALGAVPGPEGYFQKIREICDKYDVLFIADEVMTGWGRTGTAFGIEHWGVTPDIIATAKGMTSGYTPLAAIIAHNRVWEPLIANNSPFRAGHTLGANAVSSAGALAVIDYLLKNHLIGNSARVGEYFLQQLRERLLPLPLIGDVRGKGLMLGFEIVQDKAAKTPFPLEMKMSGRLQVEAFQRGLVAYSCTGCVHGDSGDMILLAPPLIITREQVDEVVNILAASVESLAGKTLKSAAQAQV